MEEASMSDRLPEEQNPIVQNANIHVTITYTRRTLLAGAAAATAAATVGTVITTMPARAADPISTEDLSAFVTLSAALTGIQDKQLAPGFDRAPPGSDSIDIKRDYFRWVKEKRSVAFEKLLGIAKGNPKPAAQAIIEQVQADPESKYLARSIVLMWYLGAWYDPDHLRALVERPNPPPAKFEVISPKAYTQGWALRVAQAHPMGFSEMQFGYWSRPPSARTDFIGN